MWKRVRNKICLSCLIYTIYIVLFLDHPRYLKGYYQNPYPSFTKLTGYLVVNWRGRKLDWQKWPFTPWGPRRCRWPYIFKYPSQRIKGVDKCLRNPTFYLYLKQKRAVQLIVYWIVKCKLYITEQGFLDNVQFDFFLKKYPLNLFIFRLKETSFLENINIVKNEN